MSQTLDYLPDERLVGPARRFQHNLPAQPTPLIGREQEVAAVCELLRRPGVRLLTLIGPPGIGKTRLCIEVASNLVSDFPHGVYFVSLAPISDPDLVPSAIAQPLGIREVQGQSLAQSLGHFLNDKQVLLVLDNFEQVVEAAPLLAELLEASPHLKVLVTSREVLHLYGEYDYPVPPLSLPDLNSLPALEMLSQYEAVALFLQRAQAVSPGFELTERNAHSVAELCLRLDCLPLAIELAAARIPVLSPEELLARLNSRLNLLRGGARNLPERQQTLQAAIDWSYNLLDPAEQTLFRRLGVFVGGCTLKAVEEVCGSNLGLETLDGVSSLVGKSLLQRQEGVAGEPRLLMLETIREYAKKKLEEGGELDSTTDRHCDYFLQLAEDAEQGTIGSETSLWMRRLDAEQNNLRAALEWSISRDGSAEKGLRLAGALGRYWQFRSYLSEAKQWCTQLLSKSESVQLSVGYAKTLRTLAFMTLEQGDFREARPIFEKSVEMSRAVGDDWGVAGALRGLASAVLWTGEYDLSHSHFIEALAIGRTLGAKYLISNALSGISLILMLKEEYRAAQAPLEEALAIDREAGNAVGMAMSLTQQGSLAFHLAEHEKAKVLLEESLGIAREIGAEWIIANCLARLGMVALYQGDPQYAEELLLEGLSRAQISGNRRWSRWYLIGLAEVARLRGKVKRAAKLIGASEGVIIATGGRYEPAMRAEIDRIIGSVRAELDEETFSTMWAEGNALSLEETIAYGMESSSTGTYEPEAPGTVERQQVYPDDLTEREVEVLRLIATGKSNQEIASELVLSLRTVERHISNIYQKIGATGKVARASAATYALRQGLMN